MYCRGYKAYKKDGVVMLKDSYNKEVILKYAKLYKELYFKKFKESPKSWFTYFQWLGTFTPASSFNEEETIYAIKVLSEC